MDGMGPVVCMRKAALKWLTNGKQLKCLQHAINGNLRKWLNSILHRILERQ